MPMNSPTRKRSDDNRDGRMIGWRGRRAHCASARAFQGQEPGDRHRDRHRDREAQERRVRAVTRPEHAEQHGRHHPSDRRARGDNGETGRPGAGAEQCGGRGHHHTVRRGVEQTESADDGQQTEQARRLAEHAEVDERQQAIAHDEDLPLADAVGEAADRHCEHEVHDRDRGEEQREELESDVGDASIADENERITDRQRTEHGRGQGDPPHGSVADDLADERASDATSWNGDAGPALDEQRQHREPDQRDTRN